MIEMLQLLATAAFAAGGAWIGISVKLRWLRRDLDRVELRVDGLEARERMRV
jgi:hypothetical protein